MLTQTARYAIRAMLYLAEQRPDVYCQTKEIADTTRIPANYLGKTLQKLAQSRLLDSQKGLHGGFRMARSSARTSLFDILLAIDVIPREPNLDLNDEEVALPSNVYAKFAELSHLYNQFLKDTMLADFVETQTSANTQTPAR